MILDYRGTVCVTLPIPNRVNAKTLFGLHKDRLPSTHHGQTDLHAVHPPQSLPTPSETETMKLEERLYSYSGYDYPPAVQSAMVPRLPPFFVRSSRIVATHEHILELWSPNSTTTPFYPGGYDRTAPPETPPIKRADGHLGRFDATISPQHFNSSSPWMPFIRRDSAGGGVECEHPRLKMVISRTQDSGHMHPAYVLSMSRRVRELEDSIDALRKRVPENHYVWLFKPPFDVTSDAISSLSDDQPFTYLVDCVATLRRSIKHAAAWVDFAGKRYDSSGSRRPEAEGIERPQSHNSLIVVVDADEGYMGFWANNCESEKVEWFLKHRIPCYIVHEVDTAADHERIRHLDKSGSYTMGTAAESLRSFANLFDMAFTAAGGVLRDAESSLGIFKTIHPSRRADRLAASPNLQDVQDADFSDPETSRTNFSVAYSQKEGFVIPPKILPTLTKKWSFWIEDLNEVYFPIFREVGKEGRKNYDGVRYYDRQLQRCLLLKETPPPMINYVADPNIFGTIAPDIPYIHIQDGKDIRYAKRSLWMYPTEKADPIMVGASYTLPTPRPTRQFDVEPRLVAPLPSTPPTPTASPKPLLEIQTTQLPKRTTILDSPGVSSGSESDFYMDVDSAPLSQPASDIPQPNEASQSIKRPQLTTTILNAPTQPASMRLQKALPSRYLTLQAPRSAKFEARPATNAMVVDPVHEALSKHQTIVPVNDIIGIKTHSQWLIISNISGMRVWGDVVRLTKAILRGNNMDGLRTIVRTDEHKDGTTTQVFWFAFNTPKQAAHFRGLISSRKLLDGPYFRCDFVSGDDFSRACGESTDRWSAKGGYFEGLNDNSPFSQPPLRSRRNEDRPKKARKLSPSPRNARPIISKPKNPSYSNIPASSSSSLHRPPGFSGNSSSSTFTSATFTFSQSMLSSRDLRRTTLSQVRAPPPSSERTVPTASLLSRISDAPGPSEFALTLADRLSEPAKPPILPACYPKPRQDHQGYRRRT
ncbi:hypothetical protein CPB83DRAFT_639624 [Crepidotus variabilis]|uniref:Uncharacterized protein n=1 Tax=Crepidotus variabilis TaxID=179855 RepID=A0A9P6E7T7_9AGAR|nr:hypothetical protein CPB83DRAFT_639624 [Crepidotus variabilis]